jgi:hypothetical protein
LHSVNLIKDEAMTSPDLAATPEPGPFASGDMAQMPPGYFDRDTPPPPAEPQTLVEMLRRRMWLTNRVAALKAEQTVLAAEGSELDKLILDAMVEQGIDTLPGVDGRTPYLYPQRFIAKRVDPDTGEPFTGEQVMAAMRVAGLGAMISENYNGNQLKAAMVELVDNDEELPPALDAVVEIHTEHTVRSRVAAAAKSRSARSLAALRAERSG